MAIVPIMIGDLRIDASISETHSFESDVTSYPVEEGANVSDNVRPLPITVTLEGIVSDTPIDAIETARNNSANPLVGPVAPTADAFAYLMGVRDARKPITVATMLRSYDNMVLQSLSIPRTADNGASLSFTCTFQQIVFVTNAVVVAVKTSGPRGGGKRYVHKPCRLVTFQKVSDLPAVAEHDSAYSIDAFGNYTLNGAHTHSSFKSYPHWPPTAEDRANNIDNANLSNLLAPPIHQNPASTWTPPAALGGGI